MARTTVSAVATPAVHRFRVSVPSADQSVLAWLAAQDNVSVSVRLLVRDAIERDGYCDVLTRPVTQQPRRGRPPGSSSTGLPDGTALSDGTEQSAQPHDAKLAGDDNGAANAMDTDDFLVEPTMTRASSGDGVNNAAPVPVPEPDPEPDPELDAVRESAADADSQAAAQAARRAVSALLTGGSNSGDTGGRSAMDAFLT